MLRDNEGQLLFKLGDTGELEQIFASMQETGSAVWRDYAENYYVDDREQEDVKKLVGAVRRLYRLQDDHASPEQVEKVLAKLLLAREFEPHTPEVEEILEEPHTVVDTTPRDKNGKPLTGSQLAWKSFREWSEAHSSSECKLRARSDDAYGDFYRKNLEREFAEQPVGDAVIPEGQVTRTQAITQELRDFARQYTLEPSVNLKPKGGLITLGGRQMSWEHFQNLLNQATAAGAL